MRRSLSVFLWILVGAMASGAGMGWTLHQSNQDRIKLTEELEKIQTSLHTIDTQRQTLDDSLQAREEDMKNLQEELQAWKRWQQALKSATPLFPPTPADTKGWSEFASIPMGVSLRVPRHVRAYTNDDGLFLRATQMVDGTEIEEQWLALIRYNREREQDLLARNPVSASVSVDFSLGNRLFHGTRGTLTEGQQNRYLLTVEENATSTYLIWAKTINGINERTILDTIATLSFR